MDGKEVQLIEVPTRAITIHNPFAAAIANNQKMVEVRTWKFWNNGEPFLIHSSQTPDQNVNLVPYSPCPDSHILATVRVYGFSDYSDIWTFKDDFKRHIVPICRWSPKLIGWSLVLENALLKPIPARGNQGVWKVSTELRRQIQEANPHLFARWWSSEQHQRC